MEQEPRQWIYITFQTHLTEYNESTSTHFKWKCLWINTLGLTNLRYSRTAKGNSDKNISYVILDSTDKCEIVTEISCGTTASPSFLYSVI